MTFDSYLAPNVGDILLYALIGGIGGAILFGGVTAFVCLLFRSEGAKKAIKAAVLIGLVLCGLPGALIGGGTVNVENMNILQSNVAKKYDTQITEMGHDEYARGAAFSPKETKMHDVTIVVNGKTELAYLEQNPNTHEPTLYDYDTKQPLKSLEKNQGK